MFRVARTLSKPVLASKALSALRPFGQTQVRCVSLFSAFEKASTETTEEESFSKSGTSTTSSTRNPYDNVKVFDPFDVKEAEKISVPFATNFDDGDKKTAYDCREGGYMTLSAADFDNLMPEGPAGELNEEFSVTLRRAWMIREPTKMLHRILDEYLISKNLKSSREWQTQGYYCPPKMEGLTNKPEWDDAKMQLFVHGKQVPRPDKQYLDGNLLISKGEGSVIETYMKSLMEQSAEIPKKIALTGPRGCGKSTILNQTVMYARSKGYLCLFINSGWDQAQGGYFVDDTFGREGQPLYDNTLMSVAALRGFYKAHADMLKTIPLTDPSVFDKFMPLVEQYRESWGKLNTYRSRGNVSFVTIRGSVEGDDSFPSEDALDAKILADFDMFDVKKATLADLILFGVAFRDCAGAVFIDMVEELKKLESVPVLIAVDQINAWDVPSAFGTDGSVIPGRNLVVPHALGFINPANKVEADKLTLKNGLFICATSHRYTECKNVSYEKYKKSIPLTVRIPNYSQLEFIGALSYYANQRLIDTRRSNAEIIGYRMFTGSNPRLARSQSIPFFLPRESGFYLGEKLTYTDLAKVDDSLTHMFDAPHKDFDLSLSELAVKPERPARNVQEEYDFVSKYLEAFIEEDDEGVDERWKSYEADLSTEDFDAEADEDQ